jgi:hypothetical protein
MGGYGLSQSPPGSNLWGEGQNLTGAQEAAIQNAQGSDSTIDWDVGNNALAPTANPAAGTAGAGLPGQKYGQIQGANLQTNDVSTTTPGVAGQVYGNAINLAQAQTQNYANQGNALLTGRGPSAPIITNADAAASQARLAAANKAYGSLEGSLAKTAAGQGPNAGQAQFAGASANAIDAAMANSRSPGGLQTAISPAAGALTNAATGAAATRGQQIAGAQSGLAGAYAGQGGMNLGNYQTQQQQAYAQAQLNAAQNVQNDQQGLNLYGLSQAQQGAANQALDTYNQGAIATENAGTAHQQTQTQQLGTEIGTGLAASGAVIGAL